MNEEVKVPVHTNIPHTYPCTHPTYTHMYTCVSAYMKIHFFITFKTEEENNCIFKVNLQSYADDIILQTSVYFVAFFGQLGGRSAEHAPEGLPAHRGECQAPPPHLLPH